MKWKYLNTGILFHFVILLCFAQNDIKDGYTYFYYPNGQISSEGYMKNGKPDGYWKTYYVSGIIKSEGMRSNFELDSTWCFYDQKGDKTEQIDYKYGKKNGYSYTYSYDKHPQGIITAKELYVNDKKQGKAFYYHSNGNLKEEVSYQDGKKQGLAREYDENGKLIILLEYHNNYLISRERINRTDAQGMKQGSWKVFYDNGSIYKEMYYVNDVLEGIYREYDEYGKIYVNLRYENGNLTIDQEVENNSMEIDYKNEYFENGSIKYSGGFKSEIPVGIHRFYDAEGKVINSQIFNDYGLIVAEGVIDETGSREGPWKDFYPDNRLKAEGVYFNNLQTGKWVFYYPDGKKEQEGTFLRGNYDGIWRWYYQNGNIWREESYFNGREDGEAVEYDMGGNIIAKGNFINGEKEGFWFYDVGDHREEGVYQTGLESGVWKHFYKDETLKFEGDYKQGLPEGKHKYYYPDGTLMEERYYQRGLKEKNWKKYNEDGNLFITITYKRDQEIRINGERINLPRPSVTRIR